MEIEKAVEEALQAKAEGVKTIKLKGGVDQKRDVELVKQIRQAIGPDLNICVDANQGYPTAKVAVKITKAMEEYNLLYMEQPVEGIDQMAEVTRRVDTPIMADESAWTPQDVIEIVQKKAADMISIYTTKPGGMFKAKKVAAVAEAAGLKCNVNGSVETGVGNAANIHLAASTGVVTFGCVVPVSTPKGKGKGGIAGIYYQDDIIHRSLRVCRRRCDRFVEAGTRHRARRRQVEAIPHFVNSQWRNELRPDKLHLMPIQKIAILGAGNGGCAAAADLTLRGFQVRLFARSESTIAKLAKLGEIELVEGGVSKKAAPFFMSPHLPPVVQGVDLDRHRHAGGWP